MSYPFYICVLILESTKYYITKIPQLLPIRIKLMENYNVINSEWIQIYKPLKIVEQFETFDIFAENNTTKKYMKLYGIENVRGGSYSNVDLDNSQIKSLEKELNDYLCVKCDKTGHFVIDCNVKYNLEKYSNNFDTSQKIKQEILNLESDLELKKILSDNIKITKYFFDYDEYCKVIDKKILNEKYLRKKIYYEKKNQPFINQELNEKINFVKTYRLFMSDTDENNCDLESSRNANFYNDYFDKLPSTFEVSKTFCNNFQTNTNSNLFLLLLDAFINKLKCLEKNIMVLKNKFEFCKDNININLLEELNLYLNMHEKNYSIIINKIYLFRRQNEIILEKLFKKHLIIQDESFENEIYKKINLLLEKQIHFIDTK